MDGRSAHLIVCSTREIHTAQQRQSRSIRSNIFFWFLVATCLRTVAASGESVSSRSEIERILRTLKYFGCDNGGSAFETIGNGRPFVTASYAQSIDAKLAPFSEGGGQLTEGNYPISCDDSLTLTHAVRSINDGIIIGSKTLLIDNPRLTNRLWGDTQPRPIVLDTQLTSTLARGDSIKLHRPIICHSDLIDPPIQQFPAADFLPCKTGRDGVIDLHDALEKLYCNYGIKNLMLEGGPSLLSSFFNNDLVDAVCITVSPQLIGHGIDVDFHRRFRLSPGTQMFLLGEDCCIVGLMST